jgi:hypothetical protein
MEQGMMRRRKEGVRMEQGMMRQTPKLPRDVVSDVAEIVWNRMNLSIKIHS